MPIRNVRYYLLEQTFGLLPLSAISRPFPECPARSCSASSGLRRGLIGRIAEEMIFGKEKVTSGAQSDIEQAYAQATQAIRELLAEGEQASEWSGWRLEVTDRAGAVVFSIDLAGRSH